MVEIIPSILTDSISEAYKLLNICEGKVHRVQIDIVDGVFSDNKTIDPSGLKKFETSLGLDFHLMVKEPVNWVEKCVDAGADRIIGQIEIMRSQSEFVEKVQASDLRVGMAIDLDTKVVSIDTKLLPLIDVVLVMSVKAGHGGQIFRESALEKIKELNELRISQRSAYKICVDGGINEYVIAELVQNGADEAVVGRALFEGDLEGNIKKLNGR